MDTNILCMFFDPLHREFGVRCTRGLALNEALRKTLTDKTSREAYIRSLRLDGRTVCGCANIRGLDLNSDTEG
jgi:hypothetical protein